MFTIQLNNRLKDLKGSKEDLGSVVDLFQLKLSWMATFSLMFNV